MTIQRATLPQEFFDVTSAQLLMQPEPQYIHAKLLLSSLSASLDNLSGLGMAVPGRQFGANGAPYSTAESDQFVFSDDIYSGAVKMIPELGKSPGHTVRINRPKYTDSTYTQASREVAAGATISQVGIDLSSEQVSMTIKRFAGPYDTANTRVAPFVVDRFDASMPIHAMDMIVNKHLQRDFHKTINAFGVVLFDTGATVVRPLGFSADASFAAVGDGPMDYDVITRTEKTLDDASIPYFPNGRRAMVLGTNQCQQLGNDPQFARYAEFHKDFNPLYQGSYWKTIGTFDIFKSSVMTTGSGTNSTPIYYGQAFGPGMVGSGAGNMPHTAFHTNDNYGETALVIWIWYACFSVLDNRFAVSIRTS